MYWPAEPARTAKIVGFARKTSKHTEFYFAQTHTISFRRCICPGVHMYSGIARAGSTLAGANAQGKSSQPFPGPKNGLERRALQFYTICDKNQVLKVKIDKVTAILVPRSGGASCRRHRALRKSLYGAVWWIFRKPAISPVPHNSPLPDARFSFTSV
jgi:hypothetical protein